MDSPIEDEYFTLDFDKKLAFSNTGDMFLNDRLMSRDMRNSFWSELLFKINQRYQKEAQKWLDAGFVKLNRYNYTLWRTGPKILLDQIIDSDHSHIQFMDYNSANCAFSWRAKLVDKDCEVLAMEDDIVIRIINNIVIDLMETHILDLQRYDPIIDVIVKNKSNIEIDLRQFVLSNVEDKIKKLVEKKILTKRTEYIIFAKNSEEYQRFLSLFTIANDDCLKIDTERYLQNLQDQKQFQRLNMMLKKAVKRKNIEMFEYLFKRCPKAIAVNNTYKDFLLRSDKKIFMSILDYIKDNEISISLEERSLDQSLSSVKLDLVLSIFEKIQQFYPTLLEDPDILCKLFEKRLLFKITNIYRQMPFKLEEKDELLQLIKLLKIIPSKMFQEKYQQRNILTIALSYKLKNLVAIIKEIFLQRGENDLWKELVLETKMYIKSKHIKKYSEMTSELRQLFETI